jgi:hypothetical protein
MSLIRTIFLNSEPRLRAGWRILGNLVLLFLCTTVFSIPLAFVPRPYPTWFFALAMGLQWVGITVAVWLSRRWLDRRSFASLGLECNRQGALDLAVGVGLAGLMMALIFLVEWAFGWIRVDGFAWQMQPWSATLGELAILLLVFIAVGWYEELLTRGYWLQNLSEGLNRFWGVLISSSVFGLLHATNPNASPIAVAWLVVAGLFFAYAYLATRSLWLPIGLHIGWNFAEGPIFGFPVSGTTSGSLIIQTPTGPEWLTGGGFGPEAGIILIVGLLLGTAIIFFYTRRRTRPLPSLPPIEPAPTLDL